MAKAYVRPTADMIRSVISYNPTTGQFHRKHGGQGVKSGSIVFGHKKVGGRIEVCVFNRRQYAHRLAWVIMTGYWPYGVIDHINGDPSDNRWHNLRDVDTATNIQNQRHAQGDTITGVLGTTRRKNGRFQARIYAKGMGTLNLGTFDTLGEASSAYINAKRKLHDGCSI